MYIKNWAFCINMSKVFTKISFVRKGGMKEGFKRLLQIFLRLDMLKLGVYIVINLDSICDATSLLGLQL